MDSTSSSGPDMGDDQELLELQSKKSRPMVAISEFIQDPLQVQSPMYTTDKPSENQTTEVTHVEVKGDGFAELTSDSVK